MIVIQVPHLASDLGGRLRAEGPHDQETDCLHVPHHLHVFMALKPSLPENAWFRFEEVDPLAPGNHRVRDLLGSEETLVVPHDLDCLVLCLNHNFQNCTTPVQFPDRNPGIPSPQRAWSMHVCSEAPPLVLCVVDQRLRQPSLVLPQAEGGSSDRRNIHVHINEVRVVHPGQGVERSR